MLRKSQSKDLRPLFFFGSTPGAADRIENRHRRTLKRSGLRRYTASLAEPRKIRLHRFLFPDNGDRLAKDPGCTVMGRHYDPVVHPFALAPRRHHARPPQIRKMPGDLRLALSQDLNEVADADLPSVHQVQQPQPGAIGERREKQGKVVYFRGTIHNFIIYALTNMSRR